MGFCGEGKIPGQFSLRAVRNSPTLKEILRFLHASAFGVSILDENLEEFKAYVDDKLRGFDFSNNYRVDFIWPANEAEKYKQDIMDIGKMSAFWG